MLEELLFYALDILFVLIIIYSSLRPNFIRSRAEKKLREYLKNHKIELELKNEHIEMRLLNDAFYCKERTNGKRQGKFFYVSGDKNHVMTAWGLINAQFNKKSTYKSIRSFYRTIGTQNVQEDVDGMGFDDYYDAEVYGLDLIMGRRSRRLIRTGRIITLNRFFHEHKNEKYPDFIMNEVQNEYCRLSLRNDGEFYILCKEIWGNKSFQIRCKNPEQILSMYLNHRKPFENYYDLLKKFKYMGGNVKVILPNEQKQIQKENKKNEQKPQQIKEEPKTNNIKRTNERNIDL